MTWTADAVGGPGLRTRTVVVHQKTRSILLIKETEGHRETQARMLGSNIAETEQRPRCWTVAAAPIASTLCWLAWCSSFVRCRSRTCSKICWIDWVNSRYRIKGVLVALTESRCPCIGCDNGPRASMCRKGGDSCGLVAIDNLVDVLSDSEFGYDRTGWRSKVNIRVA